jgi:hypothetical protein
MSISQKSQFLVIAVSCWFSIGSTLVVADHLRQTIAISQAGNVPGIPGASFTHFGGPVLNASGQVAFIAELQPGIGDVTTGNNQGIWGPDENGNLSLLARAGNYPGIPGAKFQAPFFSVSLNSAGQIAVTGYLETGTAGVTSGNRDAIWGPGPNGSFDLLVRTGASNMVPGAPSGGFTSIAGLQFNSAGQILFRALGTGNYSVFWGTNGNGELLPNTIGNPVPGLPSQDFSTYRFGALNSQGQIAYQATTTGGVHGIWASNELGDFQMIMRSGAGEVPGVPSANFSTLSEFDYSPILLNSAGQIAYQWTLQTGSGGVTNSNNRGIWRSNTTGDAQLIARTGVGGVSGIDGANFLSFNMHAMNSTGQIAFHGVLQTGAGGVTTATQNGIWAPDASGNLTLIARSGVTVVPGQPSWYGIGEFYPGILLNNHGNVLFSTSYSLLGWPPTPNSIRHDPHLIIGDHLELIEVAGVGKQISGKTITSVNTVLHAGEEAGQTILNDFGQVAFAAAFTDGSQGIFLFTPELKWRPAGSGADEWDNRQKWTLSQVPAHVHPVVFNPSSPTDLLGPTQDATVRSLDIGGGGAEAILRLQPDVVLSVADSATIRQDGWLVGTGTFASDLLVENGGTIAPGTSPGALVIDGNLTNLGRIEFEINGRVLGQYDHLIVTGDFQSGGILSVGLGFGAALGDTFKIATFESITDAGFVFDFTNAAVAPGLFWDTSQFITNGTISVVPEPSGFLLLLIASSCCLALRKRLK